MLSAAAMLAAAKAKKEVKTEFDDMDVTTMRAFLIAKSNKIEQLKA